MVTATSGPCKCLTLVTSGARRHIHICNQSATFVCLLHNVSIGIFSSSSKAVYMSFLTTMNALNYPALSIFWLKMLMLVNLYMYIVCRDFINTNLKYFLMNSRAKILLLYFIFAFLYCNTTLIFPGCDSEVGLEVAGHHTPLTSTENLPFGEYVSGHSRLRGRRRGSIPFDHPG